MCRRHFCLDCSAEMIHRDNRAFYESSSAIGQIISRDGPRSNHFGGGDIDFYWHERQRPEGTLLRLLEHKQPDQKIRYSQNVTMMDLAMVLDHFLLCAQAKRRFDPASGVFIIRGEVGAESNGRHKTFLQGPQVIERINGGAGYHKHEVASQDDFFAWLVGAPEVPLPDRRPPAGVKGWLRP